jgi:hypothetical protein
MISCNTSSSTAISSLTDGSSTRSRHYLMTLKTHPHYSKARKDQACKRRCRKCKELRSYYCQLCSNNDFIYALCSQWPISHNCKISSFILNI